ncbi:MAG: DUF4824 family protein [Sulfurimonas sp.]|uniref:DUF4824 family protein n=1 Tax=Sulfurimonas sp. TaxID=2022749 RepID=UPI002627D141|nr:DUF4824 family protein [Sulfurimonas sp.]MDD5372357.1 DUF4824 family protein [Sulfurimonas sp.]
MKIFKSSWGLFVLAFILLFFANAVVLTGVYINRTMEATSQIVLTQRELQMPYKNKRENNGMSLKLVYRILNTDISKGSYNKIPAWLNAEKLKELGFDTTNRDQGTAHYKKPPTKEVFIVLEYDGEAYKKSLALAEENFVEKEVLFNAKKDDNRTKMDYENAKKRLNREQISESRLFAIDAGLEYEKLREEYPDKNTYIIVKGLVRLVYQNKIEKEQSASIQQLNTENIYLPYKFKHVLKDITTDDDLNNRVGSAPKYEVEIKYGIRYEPWISSVETI